mgnify:FL=1
MKTSNVLKRNLDPMAAAARNIVVFVAVLSIPLTAARA